MIVLLYSNLLHSHEMLRHDLKNARVEYNTTASNILTDRQIQVDFYLALSSIKGHFLLLRYPPPTKALKMGTVSLDLYQAVSISFAVS